MSSLGWIVLALVAYLLLLFVVARMAKGGADNRTFFTAGRQAAWYQVWPAMISAAMSGITFVSVPGSVLQDGFSYMQLVVGFTIGQLLLCFWLTPRFYRLHLTSIYEYFDVRFGVRAHRATGWFFLLSKLAAGALKLCIVCLVLQQLLFEALGVPFWVNGLLTMMVVWGYTLRGGVRSVIQADWLKTTVMLGALVATLVAIAESMGWSWADAWCEVVNAPQSRMWTFDNPSADNYFWKMVVAGVVLLVAMTGLDQDLMQRNLACRSLADAQKNILLTALSQPVVIYLFLVLGLFLVRYAETMSLAVPAQSDRLFPLVAMEGGLPWWVSVLFVMGFAAGSFSAGGSALTALTTSAIVDLTDEVKRLDEQKVRRLRMKIHTLLAVLMLLLVWLFGMLSEENVLTLIYRVAGYTYGPILGLFLLGEWSRVRLEGRPVWLPMVAAPLLSGVVQWVAEAYFHYTIGFELLLVNALLTMVGLWLMRRSTTA
ncbi:MAG: sodium:solute symporter [Alistipes sp.]|nr:sodium:solute symporter [Alistipes sp.]